MDESLLDKKEGVVDNDDEHTRWVEYWHEGEQAAPVYRIWRQGSTGEGLSTSEGSAAGVEEADGGFREREGERERRPQSGKRKAALLRS